MEELLKQLAMMEQASNYSKTLLLLRALKDGAVKLENVEVTPTGWTVSSLVPKVSEAGPDILASQD